MESKNYNSEFISGLKVWQDTYNLIVREGAKDRTLQTAFVLKNLICAANLHFYAAYGEQECTEFVRVREKLKGVFDPDIELENLKIGTTLCVKLREDSHLVEKFETDSICAKYLGFSLEILQRQVKSDLSGEYINEFSYFIVRLGYPKKNNVLKVTCRDIAEVETFVL